MAVVSTIQQKPILEVPKTAVLPIHENALKVTNPVVSSSASHLVASPYTTVPHLLELAYLSSSQKLFAQALTSLEAIRPDYATAAYQHAFNWEGVCSNLRSLAVSHAYDWRAQQFYIVVFRSRIPPSTDRSHLAELDIILVQWHSSEPSKTVPLTVAELVDIVNRRSHAEATQSGGLLKYWFGVPDAEGRNLATCVWRKQADAGPASRGPGHMAAMRATMNLYTEWAIERLKLIIEDGANGWSIEAWED